nr:hypothetical protein Iba_chr02cCG9030 [Ipomoea batatas]
MKTGLPCCKIKASEGSISMEKTSDGSGVGLELQGFHVYKPILGQPDLHHLRQALPPRQDVGVVLSHELTIEWKDVVDDIVLNVVKRAAGGGVISVSEAALSERRIELDVATDDLRAEPSQLLFGGSGVGGAIFELAKRINPASQILRRRRFAAATN